MPVLLSPVSQMTPKLRKLLDIEEEKASLLGKVRTRRTPRQIDNDATVAVVTSKRRFDQAANFSAPGPFWERPVSADGRVTFHFNQSHVTKAGDGGSVLCSSKGSKSLNSSALADHDRYVSRDSAVMTITAAEFDQYAGRPGAVELDGDGTAAVFSNISKDPAVRREFWNKVHEHERARSPDAIVFFRDALPGAAWRKIAVLDRIPEEVRAIAERMSSPKAGPPKGKKKKPDGEFIIAAHEATEILSTIRAALGGWDWKSPPMKVRKGRGGRTQYRITAEFPDGLDPAARVRITLRFCALFQGAELFDGPSAMYTAAIHAPDHHNNKRNHHLHFVYSDRPARFLAEFNQWDFEVRHPVEGQHNRFNYPYRQNKIAWFSRDPDGGDSRAHRAKVIYTLRERFAEFCNEELSLAGIERHFDPRTYAAMGIDQEATKPLGPAAAALEAVGVPTRTGTENAEIIWTGAIQRVRQEAADSCQQRRAVTDRAHAKIAQMLESGLSAEAEELQREVAAYERQSHILDLHDGAYREYAVTMAMAEARPKKVIDTCSRILEALDRGKGTAAEKRDRSKIENRLGEAKDFLTRIELVHNSHKVELESVGALVRAASAEIERLNRAIKPALEQEITPSPRANVSDREPTASAERPLLKSDGVQSAKDRVNAVLDRVATENRPILPPDEGSPLYRVPGITRDEWRLLSSDAFSPLAQARLAGIAKIQHAQMQSVAHFVGRYGLERLSRVSDVHESYRTLFEQYKRFKDHPTLLRLMGVERSPSPRPSPAPLPLPSPAAAKPSAPDRDLGGLLSRVTGAWRRKTDRDPPQPVAEQQELPRSRPNPQPDKDAAIARFASEIRQSTEVRLIDVDGTTRIDAASMPEWQRSVEVFGDEPAVIEAIAAVAETRRRERELNERIIAAVEKADFCAVHRIQGQWVLQGVKGDLIDRVGRGDLDPAVTACFERVSERWAKSNRLIAEEQVVRSVVAPMPTEPSELTNDAAVPVEQQLAHVRKGLGSSR